MCVSHPQNLNLSAASSVNMEKSHEESLLSAVEDFSPQPSPTPADFSDSDKDGREQEEPLGFCSSRSLQPAVLLSRQRSILAMRGPARWLITDSIYMTGGGRNIPEKINTPPKCTHKYFLNVFKEMLK